MPIYATAILMVLLLGFWVGARDIRRSKRTIILLKLALGEGPLTNNAGHHKLLTCSRCGHALAGAQKWGTRTPWNWGYQKTPRWLRIAKCRSLSGPLR